MLSIYVFIHPTNDINDTVNLSIAPVNQEDVGDSSEEDEDDDDEDEAPVKLTKKVTSTLALLFIYCIDIYVLCSIDFILICMYTHKWLHMCITST